MKKPICTGLGITHRLADHRDVPKRIHRYVEAKPEWQFTSMLPEPLSRGVPGRFRPDALITLANTQTLVRTLSAWQRPEVNVPLSGGEMAPGIGAYRPVRTCRQTTWRREGGEGREFFAATTDTPERAAEADRGHNVLMM